MRRKPQDVEAYVLGRLEPGSIWSAAVAGFAAHLADAHRSEATNACCLMHVGWLSQAVPVGPWELETPQLARWLDGQSWSRATRRRVLTSLRTFYAWGVGEGSLEWAPVAGLQSPVNQKRGPVAMEFTPAWKEPVDAFVAWQRSSKEGRVNDPDAWEHLRMLSQVSAAPWAVTTRQLAAWLSNPDWSPQMARSVRGTLRQFYKWGVLDGRVETSPAEDLESVRVPRTLPRPTPDVPLRAALAAADQRTSLIIMLGVLGGLRRAEIAALHTRQVSESEIFIRQGRQRAQRADAPRAVGGAEC